MNFDPIAQDPLNVDNEFPSRLSSIFINSSGDRMNGVILTAQGQGPHPTILLMHGFPGFESNLDLAHVLRRAGWNVLIFHYRGAWGSQGDFSYTHVLEDVGSALDFLCEESSKELYRVESDKLVIMGHSMGGFAALMNINRMPNILGAVSIAGYNFGLAGKMIRDSNQARESFVKTFKNNTAPLKVASLDKLMEELINKCDSLDLMSHLSDISNKPVLLIGGEKDEIADMEHHYYPILSGLKKHKCKVSEKVINSDHVFSDKRIELAGSILSWLDEIYKL